MMGLKKRVDIRRRSGCIKRIMRRQVVIQTGRNAVDGENLPARIFPDQVSDRSWQPFSLDNIWDSPTSDTHNQDQLLIVPTGPVFRSSKIPHFPKLQKVQRKIAVGQQLSQPENI